MSKEEIKSKIRTIPHYPKQGIMFRDITTLIKDSDGFRKTCDMLYDHYKEKDIDIIAGIAARGFVFGSVLAYKMGIGFVLVRKPGKLPAKTLKHEYDLGHGDLLVMPPGTQAAWQHCVPKTKKPREARINLTFRQTAGATPGQRGVNAEVSDV